MCGILSDKTRSRLLKQAKLTLDGALDICRADEASVSQMRSLSAQPPNAAAAANVEGTSVDVNLLKTRRQNSSQINSKCQSQCGYCSPEMSSYRG